MCCCYPPAAYPWGGEHHRITAAAIDALPAEEQEYLRPERSALAGPYSGFPDVNWSCYGQWGGGTGDPTAPRMPDTRRLWEVSYYCQWDPVLQTGKGYSHAPPQSWEAARVHFLRAAEALEKGNLEDGCRILGVMLHYTEDSGSFPHIQPIHRSFHVKSQNNIRLEGYSPQLLGTTPDDAAKALAARVERLTGWTEERLAPLLVAVGMPLDQARSLASKHTMDAAVVQAVARLRADKPAEFEAAATDCANECTRVSADAIHSALAFAKKPYVDPKPPALKVNLVLNASFEKGETDGVPAGWCPGWLDASDRKGRAEWYRVGTHWEKHVRTGRYSALILWPPDKGLDWQQTWPKAVRVRSGERYRATVWGKMAGTAGTSYLAVQFSDTDYQPVVTAKSDALKSGAGWQQLTLEAAVPDSARWLRMILHSEGEDSATWYDDAEVVRLP